MASTNKSPRQETVIIIDDNTTNCELCQMCLELEQFRVHIAENGEYGLQIVRQIIPDVILLDIMMPVMDGFQILEKIKSDPATADIPVLVHSVRNETPAVVKALQMGANDFLKKPFDVDELIARVRKLIAFKRSREALISACSMLIKRQQVIDDELTKWAREAETLRKQFESRIINLLAGSDIAFKLEQAMSNSAQAKDLINRIVDLSAFNLRKSSALNN